MNGMNAFKYWRDVSLTVKEWGILSRSGVLDAMAHMQAKPDMTRFAAMNLITRSSGSIE
jgi:hypothetical protein